MNYKGARIRHLEIQVARLTAELDDVRRDVAMFKPIASKPLDLSRLGTIGGDLRTADRTYTINRGGIVKDGVLYLVDEAGPEHFDPPPVPA